MLWKTFGWGVLICVPVMPIEMIVGRLIVPLTALPYVHGVAHALFGAAVPEELFKFFVVVLFCMRSREFDEPMDGIVYGAVASLGFASLENVFYVAGDDHSLRIAILRALTAVPGHAFMGAIMGYYVGQARFGSAEARAANWVKAYCVPVVLHALYDFPALTVQTLEKVGPDPPAAGALPLLTVAVLIVEWRFTVRLVQQARRAQIAVVKDVVAAVATELEANDILTAMARPDALPTAAPGWVMAVLGAIIASVGGLFSLLVAVGLVMSTTSPPEMLNVIAGVVILGIAPLIAGFAVFVAGAKRIHASRVEPPPVIARSVRLT